MRFSLSPTPEDETEIEQRIGKLTEVVDQNRRFFEYFAWNCLQVRGAKPSKEDLEDVLSDAYFDAASLLKNGRFVDLQYYNAWFRKVLFLRCLQHSKRKHRELARIVTSLSEQDDVLDLGRGAGRFADDAEMPILWDELLSKLDKEDDKQIVLKSLEGYTSKEIAQSLNLSPQNIRQIKSRALRKIRNAL